MATRCGALMVPLLKHWFSFTSEFFILFFCLIAYIISVTFFYFVFWFNQIVYAKTDTKAGSKGITAFVIEKGMAGYVLFLFFL